MLMGKLIELYPTCATTLILQQLIDRIPHKSLSFDSQYMYCNLAFEIARFSPNCEERIIEAIVDKLCQLDVDIKSLKSHRKCNQFSSLSKVQSMTSFLKELSLKIPSDKETKMGLLFQQLLDYVRERMTDTRSEIDDTSFIELLFKIFEKKIFPLHKVNFMQYLPLFVIGLTKEQDNPRCVEQARLFTEKLLSFCIYKIFQVSYIHHEHLSIRQHAWNYLSSLISRENSVIKTSTVLKCLQIVIQKYEASQVEAEQQAKAQRSNSTFSDTSISETEYTKRVKASQEAIFLHCFI